MLSVFSPVNVSVPEYRLHSHSQANEPYHCRRKRFYEYLLYTVYYFCFCICSACHYEPLYLPSYLQNHKRQAKKYAKGDFTAQIDVHSNDELGHSGKHTQLHVNGTWYAWGGSAQVCFQRVTMTSAPSYLDKGYGSMLDEPSPVETRMHFKYHTFETERLNKLTKSLIDLNQFGHHGTPGYCWFWQMLCNDPHDNPSPSRVKCSEKGLSLTPLLTGKSFRARWYGQKSSRFFTTW